MQSNVVRVGVGLVLVVLAGALFALLQGKGDSETSTSSGKGKGIPTVVIKNGKPVGGIEELTYSKGDRIRFKVTSDISDEIHVHGYDLMKDVEAGGTVAFDFPATIEGLFEAELEGRGQQIAELRVNP